MSTAAAQFSQGQEGAHAALLPGVLAAGPLIRFPDGRQVILVDAPPNEERPCCPTCGRRMHRNGKDRSRGIVLPPLECPTSTRIRFQRYRCPNRKCGRTACGQKVDPVPGTRLSEAVFKTIGWTANGNVTYAHLAEEIGTSEATVRNAHRLHLVENKAVWQKPTPRALGIDGFACGGRPHIMLVDLTNRTVFDVWPIGENDKGAEDRIVERLRMIPNFERIRLVVSDMSEVLRGAIRRALPNAKHMADKIHLMRDLLRDVAAACRAYAPGAFVTVQGQKRSLARLLMILRLTRAEQAAVDAVVKEPTAEERAALPRILGALPDEAKTVLTQAIQKRRPATPHGRKRFQAKLSGAETRRLEGIIDRLTEKDRTIITKLIAYDEVIAGLYKIGLAFRNFYKQGTRNEALSAYVALRRKIEANPMAAHFSGTLNSIKKWWHEVFMYFRFEIKYTNNPTEYKIREFKKANSLGNGYAFSTLRLKMLARGGAAGRTNGSRARVPADNTGTLPRVA